MNQVVQQAPWRFITGTDGYADFSMSVSPAVERAVADGVVPPTVYLNVFSKDSITIGVFEDPNQVLDLAFCEREGIQTRRRESSGGSIYAGRGSAFLCFYLPVSLPGLPQTAAEAFPSVLGQVTEALHEVFGLKASYRPLNDIEIDGRKLVATSFKIENNVMTFRLLLNVTAINTDAAAHALPMAPEKVKDKKHKDIGSRYAYLEQEIGRSVSTAELVDWVHASARLAFGATTLEPGTLGEAEAVFSAQSTRELTSSDWFFARSEASRYGSIKQEGDFIVRGREKAPAGLIWLSLLVRHGQIVRATVNGDWHPRPLRSVEWLEQGFEGLPATHDACQQYVERFLARKDAEHAGVEPVHLMAAVDKALAELTSNQECAA